MEHFDMDSRAGYCYLIGSIVAGICDTFGTTPDQLKEDPLNAHEVVPQPVLDMLGILMSLQGFLLEEDDSRSAYLINRMLEQVGPVIYEAMGVSPALVKKQEVLH
jgi:hypothetical protein